MGIYVTPPHPNSNKNHYGTDPVVDFVTSPTLNAEIDRMTFGELARAYNALQDVTNYVLDAIDRSYEELESEIDSVREQRKGQQ